MTKQLLIFGDSLVDAGNTAFVFSQVGVDNPYQDPIYAGGGNVKASDGLVIGEHVALEMGGAVDDAQLISIFSTEGPKDVQVHNYAHAFARSDSSPMLTEQIGIGIKEQVKSFLQRKDHYQDKADVDAILNCGGNDIYAAFSQVDQIKEVISTKDRKDDRKFAKRFARPIARRIGNSINVLDGVVDEIAVAGMSPIMETPDGQDWLSNFKRKNRQRKASDLISFIGNKITKKLQNKFIDNPSVHVNDGYEVWGQLQSPSFVDGLHPDTDTASEIAKIFVSEMKDNLESFGF